MTPFDNWMSSSISCPRVIDRVVLDLDLASLAMFSEKLLSAFTGMATFWFHWCWFCTGHTMYLRRLGCSKETWNFCIYRNVGYFLFFTTCFIQKKETIVGVVAATVPAATWVNFHWKPAGISRSLLEFLFQVACFHHKGSSHRSWKRILPNKQEANRIVFFFITAVLVLLIIGLLLMGTKVGIICK